MEPLSIEGAHIRLRKAHPEDLEAMYARVWSDGALARTMLWQPTVSREEAEARMERTLAYQAQYPAYFVCLRETDEPIGFAGIREAEPGVWGESGICIARPWQGRGYGKEVLGLLLRLAFEEYGGRVFRYGCFRENVRSAAVCRALGFHYVRSEEGVRDWDGYRYTEDGYELTRE